MAARALAPHYQGTIFDQATYEETSRLELNGSQTNPLLSRTLKKQKQSSIQLSVLTFDIDCFISVVE
jgi:hypothetical protein